MNDNLKELLSPAKRYLLDDKTRAYAYLATLMSDGSPQLTPIWFNVEDGQLMINTARGRVKDRNMQADPRIALVVMDLDKPLEYIQVRGKAVEVDGANSLQHINDLAQKYQGTDWSTPEGQVRVKYHVEVDSVS